MRTTLFAAALALAASAAAAQQAPAPAQAQTRPAWMGPGLVEYLATNPADLNLTRDQQARIRQAREALDRANTPLQERMRGIHAGMVWGNLTLEQRRALADTVRQLREQAHANVLTALDATNAALTQEQKNTLEARRATQRRGGMGPGMMMGPRMGRPGMGRGMHRGMGMGGRGMGPAMDPAWDAGLRGRGMRGWRFE